MIRRMLIALAGLTALVVGLSSGAAYAYFSSHGSGTGSGTVGTSATVTVEAVTSGSPSSTLIPGGTADLLIQINNPNSYVVTITSIAQNASGTVKVVGGSGCTAGNAGVTVPTQTGLAIAVASGSQVQLNLPTAAAIATSSASGCQGATFQIPVVLTVQK